MREIKFRQRVKGIKGSENRKDNWHYWGFIDKGFVGLALGTMTIEEAKKNSQEYTGLKDKNGVEIYEGDIVRQILFNDLTSDMKIVWATEMASFKFIPANPFKYGIVDLEFSKRIEIIGNIYENPELLK